MNQQSTSVQIQLVRCPFCNEVINGNAVKCKHCKSMLNGSSSPSSAGWIVFIIAICLCFIPFVSLITPILFFVSFIIGVICICKGSIGSGIMLIILSTVIGILATLESVVLSSIFLFS